MSALATVPKTASEEMVRRQRKDSKPCAGKIKMKQVVGLLSGPDMELCSK